MSECKLNPEAKRLWLEALRGGKYTQAKTRLKTKNGFCCLGVLSDISKQGSWKETSFENSDRAFEYVPEGGGCRSTSFLPEAVAIWAFASKPLFQPLVQIDAAISDRMKGVLPGLKSLSFLNDRGLSFEEIADIIEEQL